MTEEDSDFDELEMLKEKRRQEILGEIERNRKPGVIVVDEFNFQSFLSENRFAVLDLWAEWCGPCRRIAPVIEEFASEYSGRIAFGKCNTDENRNIASGFSISAIPTMLFFSEGRLINRITGAYPKEALQKQITATFPSV